MVPVLLFLTQALAAPTAVGVVARVEGQSADGQGAATNTLLRGAVASFEACQGPLPVGQRPAGTLQWQIDIDATGKVTAVEALGDTGALASILPCLADATRLLVFPAAAGRLVVPLGFDVPAPPPNTATTNTAGPAVPQPRVDVLDVSVSDGKLTAAQVKGPVLMDKHKLTPCYRDRVAQDAALTGMVTLNLTILGGKAQTVLVGSTTLQDPATEQCLTTVLGTLRFPDERKPTQATVGLELKTSP